MTNKHWEAWLSAPLTLRWCPIKMLDSVQICSSEAFLKSGRCQTRPQDKHCCWTCLGQVMSPQGQTLIVKCSEIPLQSSPTTRILVYNAVILSTLWYAAWTWITYSRHSRALESDHQRCWHKMLRFIWEEWQTNITSHQLRLTGHVIQWPDTQHPKQVLYSELSAAQCPPGGQKKPYEDNVRVRNYKITSQTGKTPVKKEPLGKTVYIKVPLYMRKISSRLPKSSRRRRRKERITTKQAAPHTHTHSATTFVAPESASSAIWRSTTRTLPPQEDHHTGIPLITMMDK